VGPWGGEYPLVNANTRAAAGAKKQGTLHLPPGENALHVNEGQEREKKGGSGV